LSEHRSSDREEAAARWFATLRRGVMSLEERAAYDAWRSDRRNAAAIAECEAVWEALESVRAEFVDAALQTATRSRRPARYARPALVAAMCAVSLVIGALSYSGHSAFWTTLDWTDR